MNRDLQRYLDGELPRNALDAETLREAEQFEAATAAVRDATPAAPDWLAARVMSEVHTITPRRSRLRDIWEFILEPQRIRVRPITAAIAVALLAFMVWPRQREHVVVTAHNGNAVYVQFAFASADARSVAIAGDFNDWDAARVKLRDPDGDGVWTALVPLAPGDHEYMFVVDGNRWVTDPRAERYADDGFGNRNARIAVADPTETAS